MPVFSLKKPSFDYVTSKNYINICNLKLPHNETGARKSVEEFLAAIVTHIDVRCESVVAVWKGMPEKIEVVFEDHRAGMLFVAIAGSALLAPGAFSTYQVSPKYIDVAERARDTDTSTPTPDNTYFLSSESIVDIPLTDVKGVTVMDIILLLHSRQYPVHGVVLRGTRSACVRFFRSEITKMFVENHKRFGVKELPLTSHQGQVLNRPGFRGPYDLDSLKASKLQFLNYHIKVCPTGIPLSERLPSSPSEARVRKTGNPIIDRKAKKRRAEKAKKLRAGSRMLSEKDFDKSLSFQSSKDVVDREDESRDESEDE